MVVNCLDEFPHTRENDAHLYLAIIWKYLPAEIVKIDGKDFISTEAIKQISGDHVTRIRRQLNEKGLYLPRDPAVRKLRHISEEKWRNFISHETNSN